MNIYSFMYYLLIIISLFFICIYYQYRIFYTQNPGLKNHNSFIWEKNYFRHCKCVTNVLNASAIKNQIVNPKILGMHNICSETLKKKKL